MEKIRPIDQKLKYQVDKLIKIATTGAVGEQWINLLTIGLL